MYKEGKFGLVELISITTLAIVSKIFYTSTAVIINQAGTSAWYTTLISCFLSIILFMLAYSLMKRFPGKSIVQVYEKVVGKIIGKSLGFIFSFYILFYGASNLREFVEMIKSYNYPDTDLSILMICYMIVIILIVYKGIENIGKISRITIYPIIIGLFIILIMSYPYYNFDYTKPLLGYGIGNTLRTAFFRSSAYQEVTVLFVLARCAHNVKDIKKAGIISILISGTIFVISVLCYLMAFSYSMGKEYLSGIFQLSKLIYYNRYFQRVESIFLFIWIISSVLTTALAFYASMSLYCDIFEISDHRPLLLPHAFFMYIISLLPENLIQLLYFNLKINREYGLFLAFGTPILILLIARISGKKGDENEV